MEKSFTINVPDELWVDSWENNTTATYTYNGPETIYVLVDKATHSISTVAESADDLEATTEYQEVVAVNANNYTAIAHYLVGISSEYEYTYETVTNHDGSTYEQISNPSLKDYFQLIHVPIPADWDVEKQFELDPIYKEAETVNEKIAKERLAYIKKYDDTFDFSEEDQATIDNVITALTNYINSLANAYPWKYVTMDKTEIPRVPASLVTLFSSLPEIN